MRAVTAGATFFFLALRKKKPDSASWFHRDEFMMELFFQETVIGYIETVSKEQCWNDGRFTPTEHFKDYIDFFEALVNENGFDETEFDPALLDDENWYVKDDGRRINICIPAIEEDLMISFRYR